LKQFTGDITVDRSPWFNRGVTQKQPKDQLTTSVQAIPFTKIQIVHTKR